MWWGPCLLDDWHHPTTKGTDIHKRGKMITNGEASPQQAGRCHSWALLHHFLPLQCRGFNRSCTWMGSTRKQSPRSSVIHSALPKTLTAEDKQTLLDESTTRSRAEQSTACQEGLSPAQNENSISDVTHDQKHGNLRQMVGALTHPDGWRENREGCWDSVSVKPDLGSKWTNMNSMDTFKCDRCFNKILMTTPK